MTDRDGERVAESAGRRGRSAPVALPGTLRGRPPALGETLPARLVALTGSSGAVLRRWAAAEAGPGRLMLWCPVAFGSGIIAYFAADREPALWAVAALAAVAAILAVALRHRPRAFPIAVLGLAAAAGLAAATLRSAAVAHPVLDRPLFGAELTGWVAEREQRERSDRIVLDVVSVTAPRFEGRLERVRVSVRKGTAPPVGSFVSLKARLSPPPGPLRPGGYDFARDLYFKGIGASGFVLGRITLTDAPGPPSPSLRASVVITQWREAVDLRIRAAATGDSAAIASALITGKRDAITESTNEAMFVSSLGHILSISGYHMALVAGVVYVTLRALLAICAPLALRFPIRKWAAAGALIAATFYLLLSGAAIATQRSYLMTAVVLVGVMLDRPALTLRTLAVAALVLMTLSPEAVIHPSFQMSFAATMALVAAYQHGLPWMIAGAGTPAGARIALWGGREILGVVVASLVAGTATTLFAAYHFHRLAPYGLIANVLAMPVVSAWIMPAGLLGLVLMPFGFDAPLWRLMALGIEWMTGVAIFVAGLPGAVGHVTAFGPIPLVAATAGLIILCLLRSPLRWAGPALALVALLAAARTPLPDVLVAPEAEVVAVRDASGQLSIIRLGSNSFAIRSFLAADADARRPNDPGLAAGFSCDEAGCIARLADGRLVALALTAEAFAEDCRKAALIVSRRTAPPDCAAMVIDRTVWPHSGAIAATARQGGFIVTQARPAGVDRPWARNLARDPSAPASAGAADATPAAADLAPDD